MKRGTVAIIGRPNVGKSTLFNRIVGGRRAIVDDRPGVTRDRNFAEASWNGKSFWLVDTGGWIVDRNDPVTAAIRTQIEIAIAEADVIVFVVDTQEGVHPADQEVAVLVRKCRDRVVVAANKACIQAFLPVDHATCSARQTTYWIPSAHQHPPSAAPRYCTAGNTLSPPAPARSAHWGKTEPEPAQP